MEDQKFKVVLRASANYKLGWDKGNTVSKTKISWAAVACTSNSRIARARQKKSILKNNKTNNHKTKLSGYCPNQQPRQLSTPTSCGIFLFNF